MFIYFLDFNHFFSSETLRVTGFLLQHFTGENVYPQAPLLHAPRSEGDDTNAAYDDPTEREEGA